MCAAAMRVHERGDLCRCGLVTVVGDVVRVSVGMGMVMNVRRFAIVRVRVVRMAVVVVIVMMVCVMTGRMMIARVVIVRVVRRVMGRMAVNALPGGASALH
jgi:hypothetical protein